MALYVLFLDGEIVVFVLVLVHDSDFFGVYLLARYGFFYATFVKRGCFEAVVFEVFFT